MSATALVFDPPTGCSTSLATAFYAARATSLDSEWHGKLLGLIAIAGFSGYVTFVTDNIHTGTDRFDSAQRRVHPSSPRLEGLHERPQSHIT